MKNARLKIKIEKLGFDIETLRRWKKASTKSKLEFLDSALKFADATRHLPNRKKY